MLQMSQWYKFQFCHCSPNKQLQDCVMSVVLHDAYFHVSEHSCSLEVCLPMGTYSNLMSYPSASLSQHEHAWDACSLPPLMARGIKTRSHRDDRFLCGPTKDHAIWEISTILTHIKVIGLKVNSEKCSLNPKHIAQFIGIKLDSLRMLANPVTVTYSRHDRARQSNLCALSPYVLPALDKYVRTVNCSCRDSLCRPVAIKTFQKWVISLQLTPNNL